MIASPTADRRDGGDRVLGSRDSVLNGARLPQIPAQSLVESGKVGRRMDSSSLDCAPAEIGSAFVFTGQRRRLGAASDQVDLIWNRLVDTVFARIRPIRPVGRVGSVGCVGAQP